MSNKLKSAVCILIFCVTCQVVFSQSYQINSVEYDITGSTREYPLRNAVEIDTEKVFVSEEELKTYLMDIQMQLQNQRVLESASVSHTFGTVQNNDIISVNVLVTTVDSFNFFVFPVPDYDSNTGFELRLATNNYNFLGSLLPLDLDLEYNYDTDDDDYGNPNNDHILGVKASFTYPFALSIFDASWNNSLSGSYNISEADLEGSFSTSFNLSHKFNDIMSLNLGVTQGVSYNPDYTQYNDAFYLTEGASLSMPVTLAKTDTLGNITWTPQVSLTYYWDPLDLEIDIANEDLIDTNLTYQHSISFGRTNWIQNFKDGFTFSITQSLIQETYKQNFSISGNMNVQYFKAFKYVGFKSRAYLFTKQNDTEELGSRVRGIQNDDIDTGTAIIINLDLPVKVWQTDWAGYGLWDWTSFFDFEMQISPFVDIALGYNPATGSTLSPKDGWYGAGLEITGYLNAARSVVGRVSFGVDIVQFADKVGNRIDFVDDVVHNIFNTGWRKSNWYELSIGIGLFY